MNFLQTLFRNLSDNTSDQIKQLMIQRDRVLNQYKRNSSNQQRAEKFARDIQNIDTNIYDKLGTLIKRFIDKHLLHVRTKVDQPPRIDHNPLITVAIYESGRDIFKNLAKDELRSVIIDEAHLIQEREGSKNDRAKQITDNIYPIVRNVGKMQNTQLILLSGTVNPTAATNLINFFKKCFGVDIQQVRGNTRNPSDVSVLPMDELSKEDKLVQILANPKEEGNAIILFSKRKIDQVVDKALKKTQGARRTAQQIDRGDLQRPKSPEMGINLKDYEQQEPTNVPDFSNKRIKDRINELPGAENISDPRLLNCVMAGFGYIYRQDDNTKSDAENKRLGQDQQIIADLFSKGKIKSIIATDSIGIGVNMKIKNMYVPSVSKFNGSGFETLPVSDASQLYNRVGRMAYQVSNIYTPEVNMSDILNAISASNEKYDERNTIISNFDKALCGYTKRSNRMWTAAMQTTER